MPKPSFSATYHCSFCGKSNLQVSRLIQGNGAYICDSCVKLCAEIIDSEAHDSNPAANAALPKPNFSAVFLTKRAARSVKGAKAGACAFTLVHKRYNGQPKNGRNGVELQKSNILMIGPTGTRPRSSL